jgi:hypothetical protein
MLGLAMTNLSHFRRSALPVLALVAFGCQKGKSEPNASIGSASSASATASSIVPATPPDTGARAPAAETPFAGQDAGVGAFVESSAYKFRVDGVVRCADPAPDEKVPPDRRVRVAAKVTVLSKYDSFFLSARDMTLEKGGVVIDSEPTLKATRGCAPLLDQKKLDHDQTGTGFVVFQVPDETFVQSAIVAFKPTRWGGAPRTEIKLGAEGVVTGKASPGPPGK